MLLNYPFLCLFFLLLLSLTLTVSAMAETSSTTNNGKRKVLVFETEEEISVCLAKYTAELSEKFVKERGVFTVVLSGGSLIDSLRKLLEPPYINKVEWKKWHVFWVDERVVKLDDPDSNYKLAYDDFLSKVPIPSGHIYAINDKLTAEGAASDYEKKLKKLVLKRVVDLSTASGFPKFDVMLLGMGPDGHVASLFPNRPQVNEIKKWVTYITDSPKPPPERITFTFPVINSSPYIAFVTTGAAQADAVKVALGPKNNFPLLPVQLVSPPHGEITWFLDKDAASKLN